MRKLIIGMFALVILPLAYAGQSATFANKDSAIRGYDPVACFTVGEPMPGKSKYSTK